MNKTLLYLGDALHKMQAERGCAVLFVCSKGSLFKKELLKAFEESHEVFEKIRNSLKEWHEDHAFDDEFLSKMEIVLDNTETVKSRRNRILNLEFNPTEIISGYSHNVISPLMDIMVLVALFNKKNDPSKVSAYSYFLQLKEKSGRIRALGIRGLVSKSFDNREFIDRFRFLIAEQDSFKRTFFAMADDKQKKIYETIMHGNAVRKLVEIHNGLKAGHKVETPDLTPTDWFSLTSEKMSLMKRVEEKLAETLLRVDTKDGDPSQTSKISVSRTLEGINAQQREYIEELPFFMDLPEDITSSLLQHAQVREYKKGKLLFL
ncbi:MAG: nitrate- and nitrite sensing domain-containing protein, partial [Emcibacter sp.]|nr:nitrate- and nitrite sensing domain-containing protein [Emcibacter sp.]